MVASQSPGAFDIALALGCWPVRAEVLRAVHLSIVSFWLLYFFRFLYFRMSFWILGLWVLLLQLAAVGHAMARLTPEVAAPIGRLTVVAAHPQATWLVADL